MSGRKLGGGRILGSGKSLAPPAPPAHQRTSSLISSPAASTVSSGDSTASPLATSPFPESNQDLKSIVSLQNGGPSTTSGSSRLLCPICNEEMMTLLQLNRHLDDNHQELPAVEQDEVKNWFDKQVIKAKKFQPLAVMNQKLKGLDVFESNDSPPLSISASSTLPGNRLSITEPARVDPDEVVTRAHWQRSGFNDLCTEPACGKRLGAVNGNVNCRKCGRLFCEDHTMYQMKLSRSAQHEPVRGLWCRTCETCFVSREGYNDHNGLIRDDSTDFIAMRRKKIDKEYLEISRLEKRLTKLTQLLANPPEDLSGSSGGLLSLSGQKNQRKILEQSVVTWEEDTKVLKCPFCQQEFGSWSFRRHHCRLCGRVVCADPRTGCSTEIGLNVTALTDLQSEKNSTSEMSVDVRMCRDCKATVFSRKDFAAEANHQPADQRSYENLLQFERGIRSLLPNFQRLLMALQDPDHPPSQQTLTEASKVRKRLIDAFGKYDLAARRIRDLPTTSIAQAKLQRAIYQQSANFLSIHMLPLKSLPKILKHASPHGSNPHSSNGLPSNGRSALANIKYNDIDSASQISSSSAVSAMEAEEKELRERLIVLEEQKFLVADMVADAKKARRFDEVAALTGNLSDLTREIDGVNGMIGQLDFEGVYAREMGGEGASGGPLGLGR
ncbi:probable vacuolar segregation protein pep7 [Rhynchosporium graminicola]|uniref:Probable vacuolar segregation protein pep7 n=1 Tax=Rhynchosporium graminicola TaxID=2792576 RepID=A0A1E1LFZ6_9HELO|nr:probable vacuolar segregation protein pep7 [Rhynchosporium commune]